MFRPFALLALLAAPAAAQSIDTINGLAIPLQDQGDILVSSVGTELTITGSGFGGTTGVSVPKVFINSELLPKKRGLKVLSATDTELVVSVKSGVPGDFDLTVQPKGKDLEALVAEQVVRVVPPTFEQPSPAAASPETLVTLSGFFGAETFGHKPGKVKVGGRKAVLTSWTADEIVFAMPAKLVNGLHVVEVINKVAKATVESGVAEAPYCLQMTGSDFDVGGPDRFSCKVDKKKYVAGEFLGVIPSYETDPEPMLTVTGFIKPTVPTLGVTLVFPIDLETATFPLMLQGSPDGSVTLSESESIFAIPNEWSTDFDGPGADDWLIILHSYEPNAETEGTQLAGTFVASVQLVSGEGVASREITVGDFRATVDPAQP